jgi:hypothetical protein
MNVEIALRPEAPTHRTTRQVLAEEKPVDVGFSDIAGQRIFHSHSRVFLRFLNEKVQ